MQVHLSKRAVWAPLLCLGLAAVAPFAAACGDDTTTSTPSITTTPTADAASPAANVTTTSSIPADVGKDDNAQLTGAGATFPAPIYQAWFDDYNRGVAKGVQVNYQPVGSGGGIQQFTAGTVDFGASDAPMSDEEVAKAPDVQHIPTVLGGVVLTYNLEGMDKPLKLDGPTIAAIYMGEITRWDDAKIAALNAGVKLPAKGIEVVYRSDSSGTSFVFTDYLAKVSPEFKTKIGAGKAPAFPGGQGGQGNAGVTNVVKNTPNAIGYVELNYALTNQLAYADIENKAGKFVTPTVESVSAAAAGTQLPDDYRVSITDAEGENAYPIASFTYLLVHKTTGKCSQQTPLVNFLWWEVHDNAAQSAITDLNYSPLPDSLKARVSDTLKSLKCDGGASPSLAGG